MSKKITRGLLACFLLPIAVLGREEKPVRDSIPPAKQHATTKQHAPTATTPPSSTKQHSPSTNQNSSPKHHPPGKQSKPADKDPNVQYGVASFYSNKFEGRKTYTDEIFSQKKLSAASNTLPMRTWIKVTNLRNHRSVILRVNDKMHPRNRRLIDLSRAAAKKLGYTGRGLTRVRIDVLGKKRPPEAKDDQ